MTDRQKAKYIRADRDSITKLIPENSVVLDLGCGDGSLLADLVEKKNVTGRGVDIDEQNIMRCVERGLSVCHADLDKGLGDYPDDFYDYVILNQTLQVIKNPDMIIREMLRVGKFGVVGFPNFGHWLVRMKFLAGGRMPKTSLLPFEWYDTPNIHSLTIDDFRDFCRSRNISIEHEEFLICCKWLSSPVWRPLANFFALNGMFVIGRGTAS